MAERPLAIDLYTGLHGWAEGLIAAGWRVVGFDLHDMSKLLGEPLPPEHFSLVLQDVLTLHGSQFKDAELIVGSSPCTKYSYMAMPWKKAKVLADWYSDPLFPERLVELNALYEAQFRIQREASEAAGRHIPLIVENVKGAQPWVGRARWHFGSYFLWGDVPALMPVPAGKSAVKAPGLGAGWVHPSDPRHTPGLDFTRLAARSEEDGRKVPGFRFDGSGRSFQSAAVNEHIKNDHGGSWFKVGSPGQKVTGQNPDGRLWKRDPVASCGSNSPKRKGASAKIAKIPFTLAHWIGRAWLPLREVA